LVHRNAPEFNYSASVDNPPLVSPIGRPSIPIILRPSNVFAFGLILFEIVASQPASPESLSRYRVACIVAIEDSDGRLSSLCSRSLDR
jgi:hypothetical protein